MASILETHQRYAEAGVLRKRAWELEPENLDLRLAYARNLARQKKSEAALAEYEAAGVERTILGLPAADRETVLPLLDEYARLLRR